MRNTLPNNSNQLGQPGDRARPWRDFPEKLLHGAILQRPTQLAANSEVTVVSDLSYRAPSSVFRKVVIDFCHRSFDCIHHLKIKRETIQAITSLRLF